MADKDIRWQQRFTNFKKALKQLKSGVDIANSRTLSELERQGLIQSFEFTHELAWQVMKDYFRYQGNTAITGSRDAIKEAFAQGLVSNGTDWMETIVSRNKTSHTYNEETAREITDQIRNVYLDLFVAFADKMESLQHEK